MILHNGDIVVHHGDCIQVMQAMSADSVDAVVCDPPYGLSFMGREWDGWDSSHAFQAWCQQWATEALRVLKPGGMLLAFGGTRTSHRLTCGIEDAGFEIRDSITWMYGSGFPKSLDVGKAIDKAAGAEREVVGTQRLGGNALVSTKDKGGTYGVGVGVAPAGDVPITAPATPEAQQWHGWGTALKPASEPIIVARKPLSEGTVAANVLRWGTGGLHVDACRVKGELDGDPNRFAKTDGGDFASFNTAPVVRSEGRWPPNVVLTHSADCEQVGTRRVKTGGHLPSKQNAPPGSANGTMDGRDGMWSGRTAPHGKGDADGLETVQAWDCAAGCPVAELDAQSGQSTSPPIGSVARTQGYDGPSKGHEGPRVSPNGHGDTGGASRFYPAFRYQAKAGTAERPYEVDGEGRKIAHPTCKPLELMRWLVRLVAPQGALVLDPFAGSGTTGEATLLEDMRCILIEQDAEYIGLIEQRLSKPLQPGMF